MAETFPMVNSISGTPVEPSFSLPGRRAAAGDVNRYMVQPESLHHFRRTALRSHRTLVPTPRERWWCLRGLESPPQDESVLWRTRPSTLNYQLSTLLSRRLVAPKPCLP